MYMVSSSSSLRPKSQSLQKTLSSSQELGNSMLDFAHLAKTVEGKLGMEAEFKSICFNKNGGGGRCVPEFQLHLFFSVSLH